MIERVVTRVEKLSRCGVEVVSIAVSDTTENEKARKMARQKGRKACETRRRVRKLQQERSTIGQISQGLAEHEEQSIR
jgi:hypothetical protein